MFVVSVLRTVALASLSPTPNGRNSGPGMCHSSLSDRALRFCRVQIVTEAVLPEDVVSGHLTVLHLSRSRLVHVSVHARHRKFF